ncbi:MAG: alpha/beta fold hydrolase [Pseudomonadota bacterium]
MSRLEGYAIHHARVDGLNLRLALAPPPESGPARSLLLLNGRTEFVEKYAATIADLRARGFHVATLDWRGQGASDRLLSDRVRGHVDDFRDYQRDLDVLLAHVADRLPKPWYALGHSMGALILTERLVRQPDLVEKAVLSAPFFDLLAPRWKTLLGKPAVRLGRALGLGGRYFPGQQREPTAPDDLSPDGLTTDLARFETYRTLCREVPDYLLGGVTVGWLAAVVDAFDRLDRPGALEAVHLPVLILKAGEERIVSPTAADRVAARLPDPTVVDFPGAEHDLLWERDAIRDRVLDAIDRFLA